MKGLGEFLQPVVQHREWSALVPWRLRDSLERLVLERLCRRDPPAVLRIRNDPASATLIFGGDLALLHWRDGESPDEVFGAVRPVFADADFSTVNLESVLTSCDRPSGRIGRFIRSTPASVVCLKYLGITAAGCANNHALDFGEAGLAECGRVLRRAGIEWFGVQGGNGQQAGELIHEVNGLRIGLIAATDHWGGVPTGDLPSPVWLDVEHLRERVRALRILCHVVVVQLHWGYEWVMYPLQWHRDFARQLVEDGADVVCCHHAHVVMGVERWGRGAIAHGLGNFYFGSRRHRHPLARFGLVLRVSVDGHGLVAAEPLTVSTDSAGCMRLEDRTCPGFRRLCERLVDDDFLTRVERLRAEAALLHLGVDLEARIRAGDSVGLLERQVYLKAPRHDWLLMSSARAASADLRDLGAWLLNFRSQSIEAERPLELRPFSEMSGISLGRGVGTLPGRWP